MFDQKIDNYVMYIIDFIYTTINCTALMVLY